MATSSSILAWQIPWREEPGGLQIHGVAKSLALSATGWGKHLCTHQAPLGGKRLSRAAEKAGEEEAGEGV